MRRGPNRTGSSFSNKLEMASALAVVFAVVLCTHSSIFAQPRITKSFDPNWRFYKGDSNGADAAAFDDSTWRKLSVPHDWSIEGPFDPKNPTGGAGGFLPAGVGWYRKHFTVPSNYKE